MLIYILYSLLFLIFSDKRFYSLAFQPDNPDSSEHSQIGTGQLETLLSFILFIYFIYLFYLFFKTRTPALQKSNFLIDLPLIEPLPLPITDYSSIIEELKSHRKEIKKLHQECSGLIINNSFLVQILKPVIHCVLLSGFDVECDSNLCLASGGRVLENLLSTLLHEVDLTLTAPDS